MIVLGLGASVLALSLSDPGVAVVAATAGGLAAVLVAAPIGAAARAAIVGTRELRALAVAGTLAILATAWLARPLGDLVSVPAVFGAAYLAFAAAVAIRFGAIPFHLWAARVADAAPGVALPLLMAWGPAAFAAVALVWIDQSVAPLVLPFDVERGLIAAVGAVSVVLGLLAAWIQDDLEHVVGYTIVADAGFVVLGLAGPRSGDLGAEPDLAADLRRRPKRVRRVGRRAPRRLRDAAAARSSRGWARRAPVLAVALVGIAIATIGWPGLTAWEARASIANLSLPSVLAAVVTIAPLAGLAIYGRILVDRAGAGRARPSGPVAASGRRGPGRVRAGPWSASARPSGSSSGSATRWAPRWTSSGCSRPRRGRTGWAWPRSSSGRWRASRSSSRRAGWACRRRPGRCPRPSSRVRASRREPNEGPVESLPPGAVPSGPLGEEPGASLDEEPVASAPAASDAVSFEPVDSGGPDGASALSGSRSRRRAQSSGASTQRSISRS